MFFSSLLIGTAVLPSVRAVICKCAPGDSCWPSKSQWDEFNATVSGKLHLETPLAEPCYPGSAYNEEACASIDANLKDQVFIEQTTIGLSYPTESCPPVNALAGLITGTCSLGDQPVYTVNATEVDDVVKTIKYARQKNIRLVVRNTGHDILRRSTGYGSLQIWIHYLKTGISFQSTYAGSCTKSGWTGSAVSIGGGYTWEDVYPLAAANNVVVVGGGSPSVGCLGGWMQGGGHSPATHNFGLGADQVLEAQVVLASGTIVTANACQNQGLFFAIRGGGPSTYGVVVSTVIKAWPTTNIATQVLAFAPLSLTEMPAFMDAVNIMYQSYPTLGDAGFNGYGSWSIYQPPTSTDGSSPIANSTTSYIHTVANFGKTAAEAESLFAPIAAQLAPYNGTNLFMSTSYFESPSYAAYYQRFSGIVTPVGTTAALGSRFLDKKALTEDKAALNAMLKTIAGTPEQATSNNIIFMGGKGSQLYADAKDRNSGVNPAWRSMYVHNIVARGWAPGSDNATIDAVYDDITNVKVQAMKKLAPSTGSYMNEGDRNDREYLDDFYGKNKFKLWALKVFYDPSNVFYCPTCIGSGIWEADSAGKLCLKVHP